MEANSHNGFGALMSEGDDECLKRGTVDWNQRGCGNECGLCRQLNGNEGMGERKRYPDALKDCGVAYV